MRHTPPSLLVNIRLEWATNVFKVAEQADGVKLLLSKSLRHRGDTLNSPTLTVHITVLAEEVISVKATHWAGNFKVGPSFALDTDGTSEAHVERTEKSITVRSGNLSAKVNSSSNEFVLDFLDATGKRLTGHSSRSLGYVRDQRQNSYSEGLYRGQRGFIASNLDLGVRGACLRTRRTIRTFHQERANSRHLERRWWHFFRARV